MFAGNGGRNRDLGIFTAGKAMLSCPAYYSGKHYGNLLLHPHLEREKTNRMKSERICQSCAMPLPDESMLGTEIDGSKSQDYCLYCYKDGTFVQPDMTLAQMTAFLAAKMEDMKIDAPLTSNILQTLPFLKRWKQRSEILDYEV